MSKKYKYPQCQGSTHYSDGCVVEYWYVMEKDSRQSVSFSGVNAEQQALRFYHQN